MMPKITLELVLPVLAVQGSAGECIPTPQRSTGTRYEPVTLEKIDISQAMVFKGMVLAAPDRMPVANAKPAHWQAGENGRYVDRLRACLYTDSRGCYQFETEWPNLNAAQIHFIVTVEGYKTLETQWVGNDRRAEIVFNLVLVEQ